MEVYYDIEEETHQRTNEHKETNLLYHLGELFKSLYNYITWLIKNR